METETKNSSRGVKDMTVGSPYRSIISFAMPVFLSRVFQQLYNTADAFIVSRMLGSDSFAAVSSSGPLIFLLISFFMGIALGAGVVIGRYFGAGDTDKVSRAIHTDIAFGLVSGVFLTVVGMILTPYILGWMKTDPDVIGEAISYFRYYFLGSVALVMYNICRGIMNALGDSKRPLAYLIFSSLLNIVLDVVLIYFMKSVAAAAIATVISQAASVVLCMIHLCKKGNIYTVNLKKLRFHGDMLKEIIRYGLPSGVQNSVIGFANVIVQTNINSFMKFATSAYGAYSKIEGFGFLPITSFNMAITTFISQNLGAGQYERAKKGARFGIIAAVVMAELIGACIYIFAKPFIAFFDPTPEVVEFGVLQARTVSLFYFLLAYSHSIAAVCRGAGKAFVPMFIMLSIWCVLRIIYIEIVSNVWHEIHLIYWAYPLTWSISSIIYFLYYHFSDWIHGFDEEKPKVKKVKV
ncbi:MAG: MATE family efflux transporter [Clostridiales bacterium]|nr:MATE family efflux transporter [Candidatus Coliplasma equi]